MADPDHITVFRDQELIQKIGTLVIKDFILDGWVQDYTLTLIFEEAIETLEESITVQ